MYHSQISPTNKELLLGITSNSNEKVPSINLKYCYITLFMHYFIYSHTLNYIKPIDLQDFVNEAQQRDLW